ARRGPGVASRSSFPPRAHFVATLPLRAQDHLVALHLDLVGPQPLARIEAMLAGGELEWPVVPWTAHHLAVVGDIAVANRRTLVDAAVGDRVQFAVDTEHRDGAGASAERAALAFGKLVDRAKQIFSHAVSIARPG